MGGQYYRRQRRPAPQGPAPAHRSTETVSESQEYLRRVASEQMSGGESDAGTLEAFATCMERPREANLAEIPDRAQHQAQYGWAGDSRASRPEVCESYARQVAGPAAVETDLLSPVTDVADIVDAGDNARRAVGAARPQFSWQQGYVPGGGGQLPQNSHWGRASNILGGASLVRNTYGAATAETTEERLEYIANGAVDAIGLFGGPLGAVFAGSYGLASIVNNATGADETLSDATGLTDSANGQSGVELNDRQDAERRAANGDPNAQAIVQGQNQQNEQREEGYERIQELQAVGAGGRPNYRVTDEYAERMGHTFMVREEQGNCYRDEEELSLVNNVLNMFGATSRAEQQIRWDYCGAVAEDRVESVEEIDERMAPHRDALDETREQEVERAAVDRVYPHGAGRSGPPMHH